MRYRHIMLLLWISLPICVALRTIQIVFTIDSKTGFIKQQYAGIGLVISVIICAATAAVSLTPMLSQGISAKGAALFPSVAAASVLTGGMFIYQAISSLSLLNAGAWYDILLVFLSLLSAFSFLAYGLKNIYEYSMPPAIMIAPVMYYVVKLVSIFVSTSKLSLVTENVFMLFTNSAVLLFVFELAGIENGIGDAEKKQKSIFASGVAALILCVTTALPKVLLILFAKEKILYENISASLLSLAMAIFVLSYITSNYKEKTRLVSKTEPKHLA